MLTARIYRKAQPRVTVSRNQLGIPLSKRIRHRIITKINGKGKSQNCEALDQISADHSCTHHALMHIA
jgi:hypothetical protein